MLPPRSHQGDPRGLGLPEVHRGGCTRLRGAGGRLGEASRAGRSEAGRDPAARGRPCRPLLRREQPPALGGRFPSLPAPAQTPAPRARPQRRHRTAQSQQDPTHNPHGPLPSPGRRSPGPSRTLRQAAEPAGQSRPLPPRARLKRGSDSAPGSAMDHRTPLGPSPKRRTRSASYTAQAWRPRPRRSGREADDTVTLGDAPSLPANKNGGFAWRRGFPGSASQGVELSCLLTLGGALKDRFMAGRSALPKTGARSSWALVRKADSWAFPYLLNQKLGAEPKNLCFVCEC